MSDNRTGTAPDNAGKMDEATKGSLEADRLTAWFLSSGITGPWKCGQCGMRMRKARVLKAHDGRRYATLSFCSQGCLDAYRSQFKLPGTRWPKYSQDGVLLGYVVPRRGFVSLEEIEAAQDQGADE